MTTTTKIRASAGHFIVDKDEEAERLVGDFYDSIHDALEVLTKSMEQIAALHQMDEQQAEDYMSDYIGSVSGIDTINRTPLPALVKAGLEVSLKKGRPSWI